MKHTTSAETGTELTAQQQQQHNNDAARDAGQAYVQKEERAWSLNLPSGETYWYSTESAANEALADRAKLDAARLTV